MAPCDLDRPRTLLQRLRQCFHLAAINGGRHVAPLFAGGTYSPGRRCSPSRNFRGETTLAGCGWRTVATRDPPCEDFPLKSGDDYDPSVLLDLDYWVLIPR